MDDRRDLVGYGGKPPQVVWPGGARVAVSFVVNVEEGAELSIGDGDERNESVYEVREEVLGAADSCLETHFGYGPRAGYWRIAEALRQTGLQATFSVCGRAASRVPWLIRDAVARGHEVSCHGFRWERHAGMTADQERLVIENTYQSIYQAAGRAPLGWHTRSAASSDTRRLLVEHGGFLYDSDAYDDDVPYVLSVEGIPHVVLPYAFDTNDMRFQPGGGFVHGEDFYKYCWAAFDRLWREGARSCRMMSIGLHLRIIGKPARIDALERLIKDMQDRNAVWIATRCAIAAHWREAIGLAPWLARAEVISSCSRRSWTPEG
jgi:peptidoglycan/xylan/chitin deacetylase (PgdA/CDA1 family)